MKVKIVSQEYNPLLKRKEIVFEVEHAETGGTPPRLEVREKLASKLKTSLELVYVRRMETKTGTVIAVGEVNAYDSVEQAKFLEREHIVARNAPLEKAEEGKEREKGEKVAKGAKGQQGEEGEKLREVEEREKREKGERPDE
ncbi:MAG: 30S ribosomal protein S24e [Candidatus Bathyarchaeota archaeon]|nr:30S ribosomal protein S24e [Candidatus Bathyarchaeota archaeon]